MKKIMFFLMLIVSSFFMLFLYGNKLVDIVQPEIIKKSDEKNTVNRLSLKDIKNKKTDESATKNKSEIISLADFNVKPKDVISLFMQENSSDKIIKFYNERNLDLNISFKKKYQVPVFSFLIIMNPEEAKKLYESGLIDAAKSPDAVHTALFRGDYDMVNFLLEIGCPLEEKKDSMGLFSLAAVSGSKKICEMLMERGVDPFQKYQNKSALDVFAKRNRYLDSAMLKYFDSIGFELEESHAAASAETGSTANLEYLLKQHPEFAAFNENGKDLLDIAVSGRAGADTVKYLVEQGIKVEEKHLAEAEKRLEALDKNRKNYSESRFKDASEVFSYILGEINKK